MKVSVAWLQKYFTEPLPETDALVDALTFHSSEVEEVIGSGSNAVLDVKVLPDRAPYALSHRGVASELAAALDTSLYNDPLRSALPEYSVESAQKASITVSIEDTTKCTRYMAARLSSVTVGPSPEWLKVALEQIGQRSINNVVDATNYVMLNLGQPLHAFDAAMLVQSTVSEGAEGSVAITVRGATKDERITTLTGEAYTLPEGTLLITDGATGVPLGIAGVKGGKAAEVTTATTELIIESANFNGTSTRRTSQALKLWTDASLRFQNNLSPELVAYGMRDVVALILECAGGQLQGVVDTYPNPEPPQPVVTLTLTQLNGLLGASFTSDDLTSALVRLALPFETASHSTGVFSVLVTPPFERRDIVVWQDLAEEVGRTLGYERIVPTQLPPIEGVPDQRRFNGIERIKDFLTERGFTELSTQAFAAEGVIRLANPLQQERPWLRASLSKNMEAALAHAATVAPRVLGPESSLTLFELGTVFEKETEYLSLCLGYRALSGKSSTQLLSEVVEALYETFPSIGAVKAIESSTGVMEFSLAEADLEALGEGYTPAGHALGPYTPFSLYPSALRDVAVWTPEGTEESEVGLCITKVAGDLLVRIDQFDRFEKDGRTSHAFRLVFQSFERTLADTDLDPTMERITTALNANDGWEVR